MGPIVRGKNPQPGVLRWETHPGCGDAVAGRKKKKINKIA